MSNQKSEKPLELNSENNFVKCITISTDASFHPEEKASGFAFQIVCDKFKIKHAGNFKTKPNSSIDAELMCIGNALRTLQKVKNLPKSKWLIVNSDCLYGIRRILKPHGRKTLCGKVRRIWIQTIGMLECTKYELRHVKSHNLHNDDSARSHVNDWCDLEAKKFMRKELNEIRKQKKKIQNENLKS